MTATPAQIANDMAAQAAWWRGRDREIERACREAAWVIRELLAGRKVDGRTWGGLHGRLLRLEHSLRIDLEHVVGLSEVPAGMDWKFTRARLTIERLLREAGR